MANYLPLLLLGGGAVYLMTQGKKKKTDAKVNGKPKEKPPVLWVSDDCTKIKVLGYTPEELKVKAQDQEFIKQYKEDINKWSKEILDLEGWFQERPGITATDLDDLALEISMWRYPQCDFSEGMDLDTPAFNLYITTFAAVIAYAVKNRIVALKDVMDTLQEGIVESLGPMAPEGTTAVMQLPPQLEMMFAAAG